ncbi:ompA family protein [Burkholderia pseudomallei MSHR7527]|uniref:OmpA family protein n=1 Tax=Burkholderia pseudomallei TaxID=28450 RepID=UPI0005322409|nr:OmpA family protein [Burkholderia pseudomallei]KGS63867.1 ompA family protein [Burkholderia pseudomallei MSHR7527]
MSRQIRFWLVWGAIPFVVLASLCLPLRMQPEWSHVLTIVLVIAAIVLAIEIFEHSRETAQDRTAEAEIDDHELAVIIVAGPHASSLFNSSGDDTAFRREAGALWLRADSVEQLRDTMMRVKASRGRFPDAAVVPLVSESDDESDMRQAFAKWRTELREALCYPDAAYVLPCYLAVYTCLGFKGADGARPKWTGDAIEIGTRQMNAASKVGELLASIRQQLLRPSPTGSSAQCALGLGVFDWLDATALLSSMTMLANTPPFMLKGLTLADVGRRPIRPGAWTRWLTVRTGLHIRQTKSSMAPLPVPRVAKHAESGIREGWSSARHLVSTRASFVPALVFSTVSTLGIAVAVSGWMNSRMIQRVSNDIADYRGGADEWIGRKRFAQARLEHDRTAIVQTLLDGVPTGFGWGLYRGQELLVKLDTVLDSPRTASIAMQLDTVSLFAAGKATFSPGAAQRELQHALRMILANPEQRVLIVGHADSSGSDAANFQLSEARARAIRDWFVDQGVLKTRFIVQGAGDTHPIADNDSPSGRAQNRRVEVLLIPDVSSDRKASGTEL